jgi:arylsulfatase A-like enzyme
VGPLVFFRRKGAPRRPNIIVVLADDLGWRGPACYGNRFNETRTNTDG